MKDFDEQDIFGDEKPAKAEKKDSAPQLGLYFSAPKKDETEPQPENKALKPAKAKSHTEKKPVILSREMKKTGAEKTSAAPKTILINEPPPQDRPHKSLHELKKLAQEAPADGDEKKDSAEKTEAEPHHEKKMTEKTPAPEKTISKEPDKSAPSQPAAPKQHSDSPIKQGTGRETQTKKTVSPLRPPPFRPAPRHITPTAESSIGHILQEARVEAGLSIDQVSIETRIKKSYIDAIERDDFDSLPSSVYVSAYVRRLCQQYDIDQSVAQKVGKGGKLKPQDTNVSAEVLADLEKSKQVNAEKQKRLRIMRAVISLAAVAVIAVAAIIILSRAPAKKADKTPGAAAAPGAKKTSGIPPEEIDRKLRDIIVKYPTGNMSELKAPEE